FLRTCRYVSDERQFRRSDYWMPPEEFEKRRQGDCDCFALWTWRQVLQMGYEARYVVGWMRNGASHAWVTFCKDGQCFLLWPLAAFVSRDMPRLRTLSYVPRMSVSWDGRDVRFYEHEDRAYAPSLGHVCSLLSKYILYEVQHGPRLAFLWC